MSKCCVGILLTAAVASPLPGLAAPLEAGKPGVAHSRPCSSAEYRQFDFWLGTWAVTDADTGALDSRVRITSVQDGCGLREQYFGAGGATGESLSMYDRQHRAWSQTWVSSGGEIVQLAGGLVGGSMQLSGELTGADSTLKVRGVWSATPYGVHEVGEKSVDGQTWRPWFDLQFRRGPASRKAP